MGLLIHKIQIVEPQRRLFVCKNNPTAHRKTKIVYNYGLYTVELQWLEYLEHHENMFETGVVRAKGC